MELLVAAHEAHNAGVTVSELWTSWLDTPPERAVIEARIEGDQHDAVLERLDDAVDQVLQALRERGFEAIFHRRERDARRTAANLDAAVRHSSRSLCA